MKRILAYFYFLPVIGLFLYSFTQVDLSLTLSKISIYQTVEKTLQHVGFFDRPLSAGLFIVISISLLLFYAYFLNVAKKRKLKMSQVWFLVAVTTVLLMFSYNAFSYDLFNYIFDAKILAFYHLNPYFHKALDFPNDPMLSFMRWTHRTYPYGPSWLILTVPLSFIGSKIFLLTFFLFKIMIASTYFGSVYLIYKISEIKFESDKVFNTVFFALNPLILIEGLVSSHNDFPLVFFALLSIYLYIQKKRFYAWVSLLFSIGVKFSTFILILIFTVAFYLEKNKKQIDWEKLIIYSVLFSLGTVFLVTFRTTFQPWYLVLPISLGALISKKSYVWASTFCATIVCLIIYTIYVFISDYAPGYSQIIANVEWSGLVVTFALTALVFVKDRGLNKN